MGRPKGSKNGQHTFVVVTCEACGRHFNVKPSKAAKRRYCSMECSKLEPRSCDYCGATYMPTTVSRRYCSRKCAGAARGTLSREKILARVQHIGDCWIWTGTKTGSGYGLIKDHGQVVRAHRASYELFVGPIPDHMCVLHRCDAEDGSSPPRS